MGGVFMNQTELYRNIAGRCDGDIYVGVVGPVRTGKSTFIKRFMELLVIPNMEGEGNIERTVDELPQGGAGKTVMTTQPKFIPCDGATISLNDGVSARIRLADSAGYLIPGVLGLSEEDGIRMVRTPWYDYDIPFEEAAEIGTRRIIKDHATIGIVVTTDGSILDLPRSAYQEAEERVIRELKALGKPFAVVLNSRDPDSPAASRLASSLSEKYGVAVHGLNVQELTLDQINGLMESVLTEFTPREIRIHAPSWLTSLNDTHWLGKSVNESVLSAIQSVSRMRDHGQIKRALEENPYTEDVSGATVNLNEGTIEFRLTMKDGLYYKILGEACGQEIEGEEHLFELMKEFVNAKREYDRVAGALESVRKTGYGMVTPTMEEMELHDPVVVRQGSGYGVKLKATAPSLHMVRVDIQTEVNPIAGTQKQSEEFIEYLQGGMERDRTGIWETEVFGKSLNELVRDGLGSKLNRMPGEVQEKMREALEKIVNEGNGGMICILL